MTGRPRLLVLLAGIGALVASSPALGCPGPPGRPHPPAPRAVALLDLAARAARTRTWTATQYVGSRRGGVPSVAVLQVDHAPDSGTVVHAVTGTAARPDALDEQLVAVLAAHYALQVTGASACSGRPATLVSARRSDDGSVAGRFWVDDATGLVLRREVLDRTGAPVRSSAYVDLELADAVVQPAQVAPVVAPPRDAPLHLAGGLALVGTSVHEHDGGQVRQLSYADGLSTVAVFVQPGALPPGGLPGFGQERRAGQVVWVQHGATERVVWQGGGSTYTLVSDAADDVVDQALSALPHGAAPSGGPVSRLRRGLDRVGSWLDPFR